MEALQWLFFEALAVAIHEIIVEWLAVAAWLQPALKHEQVDHKNGPQYQDMQCFMHFQHLFR